MTKQGVRGKYQRTLNEINTNTHKTTSTNYNKVQVIYYHLDLGGTIIIQMPSEQDVVSH